MKTSWSLLRRKINFYQYKYYSLLVLKRNLAAVSGRIVNQRFYKLFRTSRILQNQIVCYTLESILQLNSTTTDHSPITWEILLRVGYVRSQVSHYNKAYLPEKLSSSKLFPYLFSERRNYYCAQKNISTKRVQKATCNNFFLTLKAIVN